MDLRWGVTDEQKSEGQVLPICLAEIRRCRPYFIGLLGERYGWVPEEISPALLDEERWLDGLPGRSVTELEILHGVLNDSAMAEHAFFYFRSAAYLDSLPHEQRSAFQESSTPTDIAQFGVSIQDDGGQVDVIADPVGAHGPLRASRTIQSDLRQET